MKVRVFVATTEGPVRILRITEEDPEVPSCVCLNRTIEVSPISPSYQRFVQRGTGLVSRFTKHSSYRLDVDKRIDSGVSWQFPFLLAHLLQKQGRLADLDDEADLTLYATGEVGQDVKIGEVAHVPEKIELILENLDSESSIDRSNTTILIPDGQRPQAKSGAHVPPIIEIGTLTDIESLDCFADVQIEALNENAPSTSGLNEREQQDKQFRWQKRHSVLLMGCLSLGLLGVGFWFWTTGPAKWEEMFQNGDYIGLSQSLEHTEVPFMVDWFKERLKDSALSKKSISISALELRVQGTNRCTGRFGGPLPQEKPVEIRSDNVLLSNKANSLCGVIYRVENNSQEFAYVYLLAFLGGDVSSAEGLGDINVSALPPKGQIELKLDTLPVSGGNITVLAIAVPRPSSILRLKLNEIVSGNTENTTFLLDPERAEELGVTLKVVQHQISIGVQSN